VKVAKLAEGAVHVALSWAAGGAAKWKTELLKIWAGLVQLGNIRIRELRILVINHLAIINVPGYQLWRKNKTV
jgi:hypothetical protein